MLTIRSLGVLVFLVLALANGGRDAAKGQAEPGPVYEGQSLTHWIAALQDANPKVRLQAATALGKMGVTRSGAAWKPAIPALIERFQDADQAVFPATAVAPGGSPDAMPDLCRALAHKDAQGRRWSAFARGEMGRGPTGRLPA